MGKIQMSAVRQGMILAESIYSPTGDGKLLLKQGTRLTNPVIDKLRSLNFNILDITDPYTLYVRPEENMERLLENKLDIAFSRTTSEYKEGNMNDEMFIAAKEVKKIAKKIIKSAEILKECVALQITNYKNLLETGIYTSVYSMLIARVMNLSDEEIYNIGAAALIHDIGLCEMPHLVEATELSKTMENLYREHPSYGYYMMSEKNISRDITQLIYSHHERYDGTGYPRALKGEDIPIGARIISVCSDYVFMVNVRGLQPYEAIEYIYGNSNIAYDSKIVKAFSSNIPVYPLGALVKLTTGEIGIVANVRRNEGPRPIVCVHYNRVLKPLSDFKIVDLGQEKTIFIKEIINY